MAGAVKKLPGLGGAMKEGELRQTNAHISRSLSASGQGSLPPGMTSPFMLALCDMAVAGAAENAGISPPQSPSRITQMHVVRQEIITGL
jgi:hypothetical protein